MMHEKGYLAWGDFCFLFLARNVRVGIASIGARNIHMHSKIMLTPFGSTADQTPSATW
jgi:hypothetical protein